MKMSSFANTVQQVSCPATILTFKIDRLFEFFYLFFFSKYDTHLATLQILVTGAKHKFQKRNKCTLKILVFPSYILKFIFIFRRSCWLRNVPVKLYCENEPVFSTTACLTLIIALDFT